MYDAVHDAMPFVHQAKHDAMLLAQHFIVILAHVPLHQVVHDAMLPAQHFVVVLAHICSASSCA